MPDFCSSCSVSFILASSTSAPFVIVKGASGCARRAHRGGTFFLLALISQSVESEGGKKGKVNCFQVSCSVFQHWCIFWWGENKWKNVCFLLLFFFSPPFSPSFHLFTSNTRLSNQSKLSLDKRHSPRLLFQALEAISEVGDLLQLKYSRREQPFPPLGWISEESHLQDWASPSYLTVLPLLSFIEIPHNLFKFILFFCSPFFSDEPVSTFSCFISFYTRFPSPHSCSRSQLIHLYPGRMSASWQTVSREAFSHSFCFTEVLSLHFYLCNNNHKVDLK